MLAWSVGQRLGVGKSLHIINELVRCALQAGDHAGAVFWLTQGEADAEAGGNPDRRAEFLILRAKTLRGQGHDEAAVRCLDEAARPPGTSWPVQQWLSIERLRHTVEPDGALLLDTLEAGLSRFLL